MGNIVIPIEVVTHIAAFLAGMAFVLILFYILYKKWQNEQK